MYEVKRLVRKIIESFFITPEDDTLVAERNVCPLATFYHTENDGK